MSPQRAARPLLESFVVFALGLAAVALLWALARVIPFVAWHMQALVAGVFLYFPVFMAWRRGRDLADHGFGLGRHTIPFALVVTALALGLFFAGFLFFYGQVCAADAQPPWSMLAAKSWCQRWLGWQGFDRVRFPPDFPSLVLTQLVVVALPEELFFRGYLHGRLEEALPPRRRILRGGIGWALVISSAMFAVAHVITDQDPRRLATFFPGLVFGWLRSSTRSVAAGTVVHASSNLFIEVLHRTFFRGWS